MDNIVINVTESVEDVTIEVVESAEDVTIEVAEISEWLAETVSQEEAEAGTATDRRAWTAQRVKQAIEALERKITYGTADPTGGSDGDIYLQYED